MLYALKQTWLKLLIRQTESTQYGLVARFCPVSRSLKINGSLKKNIKNSEMKFCIKNVFENIIPIFNKIDCFQYIQII